MSNFITNCINGDALLSEVVDYIDNWHEGDSELSLHEYLGMTTKEYALYVQDEQYLATIVAAHKEGVNIRVMVESQVALAARSDDQAKSKKLQKWLKNEGLWE
jgi:hypothetical protein